MNHPALGATCLDLHDSRKPLAVRGDRIGADGNRLAAEIDRRMSGPVVLDLAAIQYVGSEDLSTLIGLHKQVRAAGGRLALVNVRPHVSNVLAITRLDTLIDVRA